MADAPVAAPAQVGTRRVPVVAHVPVGSAVRAPVAALVGPVAPVALLVVARVGVPVLAGSVGRLADQSGVVVAIKTSFSRSI